MRSGRMVGDTDIPSKGVMVRPSGRVSVTLVFGSYTRTSIRLACSSSLTDIVAVAGALTDEVTIAPGNAFAMTAAWALDGDDRKTFTVDLRLVWPDTPIKYAPDCEGC